MHLYICIYIYIKINEIKSKRTRRHRRGCSRRQRSCPPRPSRNSHALSRRKSQRKWFVIFSMPNFRWQKWHIYQLNTLFDRQNLSHTVSTGADAAGDSGAVRLIPLGPFMGFPVRYREKGAYDSQLTYKTVNSHIR